MATLKVYASEDAANKAGATGTYYTSIQEAVNAANSGDKIEIAAGTYADDVTLQKGVTGGSKTLNFVGVGDVIITGKVTISKNRDQQWDDNVDFKNITFQQVNEDGEVKGGVVIGKGQPSLFSTFTDCDFVGAGLDANVLSIPSGANGAGSKYENCTFSNSILSTYGNEEFDKCEFNNASINDQSGSLSVKKSTFNVEFTSDMVEKDFFMVRGNVSGVDNRNIESCTFNFDNSENLTPEEGIIWTAVWARATNTGALNLSNCEITGADENVDVFCDAEGSEGNTSSINAKGLTANVDLAEAAKGVANVTIENENEDGTTSVIITDATGDSILVGTVEDDKLTVEAGSEGDFEDIAAEYMGGTEEDPNVAFVVTPDGVYTGYKSFDAAAEAATEADKILVPAGAEAASEGLIMNAAGEAYDEVAEATYAGIEVKGDLAAATAIVMHNAKFTVVEGGYVQTGDGALRIMGKGGDLTINGVREEDAEFDVNDVFENNPVGGGIIVTDAVSAKVNALHLAYGATGTISDANIVINSNQGIIIGYTLHEKAQDGINYSANLEVSNSAIVFLNEGSYGNEGGVAVINRSSLSLTNNSILTPAYGIGGAGISCDLTVGEDSTFSIDSTSFASLTNIDNAGTLDLTVSSVDAFQFYGADVDIKLGNIFVADAVLEFDGTWSNTGKITVDLEGCDDYIVRIIDNVGETPLTYADYGNVVLENAEGYNTIVIDNDLYATNADLSTIYVDNTWTATTALNQDKYLNINALTSFAGALKQFVPQTELIEIATNHEEAAPTSNIDVKIEKDLTIAGKLTDKQNGGEITWAQADGTRVLTFTAAEDAAEDAKLTFQNFKFDASQAKTVLLFGVDTVIDANSSLTFYNGNVNNGATLEQNGILNTAAAGTESFNVEGGAQWIINGNLSKTEEGEEPVPQTVVHYSTIFDGTATLNDDTYFVAVDQLTVGDASDKENVLDGTFTANNSLVQIGGILPYNPVTNGIGELYVRTADSVVTLYNSVFKSNGNIENAGTISINGSEFYTNVDDNADVTVTNSGIINISGESTVEIENYVKKDNGVINALDGAVITDSTIKTTVTLNGTTTWEDVTVNALDFGWFFTPDADITANMSGNLNVNNFMVTLNEDNEGDEVLTLNIGKEPASEEEDNRTTLNGNQYNFGGNSVVNIVNTDFTGNYLNMTGKITIKDSIGTIIPYYGDMIVAEAAEGAETVFDNAQVSGVTAYVGGWKADAEGYGKLTLKNGSEWAASGNMIVTETSEIFLYDSALDIEGTITNNGSITMDASSSIEAGSIIFRKEVVKNEAGEDSGYKVLNAITIDAAEFAGFNKVLDFTVDITAEWEGNEYTIENRGDVNFFLHKGDLYATTIDTTDRYIDAAWADMSLDTEYGDSVAADKVFGYNAFGNLADALDGAKNITLNIIASDINYVAPDADKDIAEVINPIDAAATIEGDVDVTLKGEATFTGNQLTVNGALNITEEADFTFGNTVMVKGELDITDAEAEFSTLSVLGKATVGADADVIVTNLTIRDDDGSFSVVDGAVVTVNNTLNVGYWVNNTNQIGTLEVTDATFAANKALKVTDGSSATFTDSEVTLATVTGAGDIDVVDSTITLTSAKGGDFSGAIDFDGNNTITGAGKLDLSNASVTVSATDKTVENVLNIVNDADVTLNVAKNVFAELNIDGATLNQIGGTLQQNVTVTGDGVLNINQSVTITEDKMIDLSNGSLTIATGATIDGQESDIFMDYLSTITFYDKFFTECDITLDVAGYQKGDGALTIFDYDGGDASVTLDKAYYADLLGMTVEELDESGAFFVENNDLIYDLDRVTADGYDALVADPDKYIYVTIEDGEFAENVQLYGKDSTIKGGEFGVDLPYSVSGGVISEAASEEIADILESKVADGDVSLTIEDGSFGGVVMGADRVNSGTFARVGDIDVEIENGTFAKQIFGGGYYNDTDDLKGRLIVAGDIDLKITGGEFNGWIYGGNGAADSYTSACTLVDGDITITIDTAAKILGDSYIIAGSYGSGVVAGDTNVVFTGNVAEGESFLGTNNTVWGGSSNDGYKVVDGERVFQTTVTGARTITFDDFAGDFGGVIRGFDTFKVLNDSDVTVAYENLSDITAWEFDADSDFRGAFGNIDGDDLIINGKIENGWELGGVGKIEGMFDSVKLNGVEATLDGSVWTAGDYTLEIEDNTLKFSALA